MSCFQPLRGIDLGYTQDGKRNIKVFPHNAMPACGLRQDVKYIEIPCGHCIGCRMAQSREWSNRLLMESLYHQDNYFITLSYCDQYAVTLPSADLDTGEYVDRQTLYKRDVQNFVKRLRKKFNNSKFRYYCVGEYSPVKQRPHYHMILFCDFGIDPLTKEKEGFNDLIFARMSESGGTSYDSKTLDSLWLHSADRQKEILKNFSVNMPLGMNAEAKKAGHDASLLGWTDIAKANYYTMRYVAGYVTQKLGEHPNEWYVSENRNPPFALSSRRPGIGFQFLVDHPEIMEQDQVLIGQPSGVVEFMPPKYFRKKCGEYDPGLMDQISDKHIMASDARVRAKLSRTTLDEENYNKLMNQQALDRKALRNKL